MHVSISNPKRNYRHLQITYLRNRHLISADILPRLTTSLSNITKRGSNLGTKFKLRAYFKTGADPTPAKETVAALFEEANSTLLTKGAPEGQGAKITEWELGEGRIELTLESGRYVRVHDAVLRLKKVLSEQMGKKYRIGIRGIEVESFTIQVPAEHELRMLKVPYIKGMENIEGGIMLELEVGEAEMKNRFPDRILTLLEEKIEAAQYGAKAEHWNLIWQREPMEHPFNERYMHIFNDILDIEWRKARVTPWFMAQEGLLGLAEENTAGTTDYEACLPYRGKNGEWLEFQNVSINGDKYPKGFNVKLQSGEELWSGCSGVGLERWAAVFLAQKGLDLKIGMRSSGKE